MITCKLQGGIGNQLFQIATTFALAKRYNLDYGFIFDQCHTPLQGHPSNKYRNNILKNIPEFQGVIGYMYKEPEHPFNPISVRDGLYLEGYFQSEKYFLDYKKEIVELFDIRPLYLAKDYATLHVRRGDYLNNPNIHPTCSIDYYDKAISLVGKKPIFVMSDDLPWCQENIKGSNIHYYDGDEIKSLQVMIGATDSVIANSSFSWWGAWLRKNKGKTIAPRIWFGPDGPDARDIIPERWIRI